MVRYNVNPTPDLCNAIIDKVEIWKFYLPVRRRFTVRLTIASTLYSVLREPKMSMGRIFQEKFVR